MTKSILLEHRALYWELRAGENITISIYICMWIYIYGFPGNSAGKETTCNSGDPSLIPGLGASPGEGIGYPLQYACASLVAQMVKNLPVKQETQVRFLGQEDLLEKG